MIAIKIVLKKLSFLLNLDTYPVTTKAMDINKIGLKTKFSLVYRFG